MLLNPVFSLAHPSSPLHVLLGWMHFRPGMKWHLLVPIVNILFGASQLVPQAHAHHIGHAFEQGGHPSKALDPNVRTEVLVAKETIAIKAAAAPTRLAYLIVQYNHHIVLPKARYHCLQVKINK